MSQNRYALFIGDAFYPKGGWEDFVGFFNDIEVAKAAIVEPAEDCTSGWWFNIADLTNGEIVAHDRGLPSRWADRQREGAAEEGALSGEEESLTPHDDAAEEWPLLLRGGG
jgi:hypothetical protein